ncbi:peptide chain release factor N(5)-glutamine methyltransferase [Chloroflexota bacterium]
MRLKQALSHAREILTANDIDDPSLESELLIRHTLNINRVQLYLTLYDELKDEEEDIFRQMLIRRLSGEPTAYITGHREFYGYNFYVNHNVLIPRPESELLVEKTIEIAKNYTAPIITEIGSGSGAIAISLALNIPNALIYASDISASALKVARTNCQKHEVSDNIRLIKGDMLSELPISSDIIIANLPYVKESEIDPDNYEPQLALDGGKDGLDKIRQLCQQLKNRLHPDGSLLLEIGKGQKEAVCDILHHLYPKGEIEITRDLADIDRVVRLTHTSGRQENNRMRQQKAILV